MWTWQSCLRRMRLLNCVNFSTYMQRIKTLVMEGLGYTRDQGGVLAVEVNLFGKNNESFSSEKRLVIRNTQAEVTNQRQAFAGATDQSEARITVTSAASNPPPSPSAERVKMSVRSSPSQFPPNNYNCVPAVGPSLSSLPDGQCCQRPVPAIPAWSGKYSVLIG